VKKQQTSCLTPSLEKTEAGTSHHTLFEVGAHMLEDGRQDFIEFHTFRALRDAEDEKLVPAITQQGCMTFRSGKNENKLKRPLRC